MTKILGLQRRAVPNESDADAPPNVSVTSCGTNSCGAAS